MPISSDFEKLSVGEIVDNQFEVCAERITGGMSWVYPVVHKLDKTKYALKVARSDKNRDDSELAFRRELKALKNLSLRL